MLVLVEWHHQYQEVVVRITVISQEMRRQETGEC